MRIRKRQVPLPLSSLSPVPLSDLHMEPPVQLPSPPLDHQHSLIRRRSAHLEEEEEEEARSWNEGEIKKISNDSKTPISSASISSSHTNQVNRRWCDGDKAFPLKKRRGNNITVEKDHEATSTMMSKMKNKSSRIDYVSLEDDDDNDIVMKKTKKNDKKNMILMRSGKGGEVIEGSRCSRVNGRGWRCCQQTLVGYSLCEHHLGKGRLRSNMSKTKPKKTMKNKKNIIDRVDNDNYKVMSLEITESESKPASRFLSDDDDEEEVKDDEKRVKVGMVKARSISSLLGQTQTDNHPKVIVTYAVARDHDHMHIS